jgi:hypothetical protein
VPQPHSLAVRFGPNHSPFAPQDVIRVSEFFGGDLDSTYGFCRTTWLPDAELTLHKLDAALSRLDVRTSMYLCDHLREGARSVGARTFMTHVEHIECAARERDWPSASRLAIYAAHYVHSVHAWLGERFEAAANSTSALEASLVSDDEDQNDASLRQHRGVSRKRGAKRQGKCANILSSRVRA